MHLSISQDTCLSPVSWVGGAGGLQTYKLQYDYRKKSFIKKTAACVGRYSVTVSIHH
jgi:hypothetical protein